MGTFDPDTESEEGLDSSLSRQNSSANPAFPKQAGQPHGGFGDRNNPDYE